MLALFTDFGATDLYVGQLKARLLQQCPELGIVDVLHDAPAFRVEESAHLLAALWQQIPEPAVWLAVVDPGVGTGRQALALKVDGRWLVGPDNGLCSIVTQRATQLECYRVVWRPAELSRSFHGRDLFAPMAGFLHSGGASDKLEAVQAPQVQLNAADLARIIYCDHYGNAMLGVRACKLDQASVLRVAGCSVAHATIFADAPVNTPFWYENSLGLVEIAWPQGSAVKQLSLQIGQAVEIAC